MGSRFRGNDGIKFRDTTINHPNRSFSMRERMSDHLVGNFIDPLGPRIPLIDPLLLDLLQGPRDERPGGKAALDQRAAADGQMRLFP